MKQRRQVAQFTPGLGGQILTLNFGRGSVVRIFTKQIRDEARQDPNPHTPPVVQIWSGGGGTYELNLAVLAPLCGSVAFQGGLRTAAGQTVRFTMKPGLPAGSYPVKNMLAGHNGIPLRVALSDARDGGKLMVVCAQKSGPGFESIHQGNAS